MSAAMTIAEGDIRFKTDASIIFGGNSKIRKYVLRTSYDSIEVWKTKYINQPTSPFSCMVKNAYKKAAIIDNEVWVFGIDSTNSIDIVSAVEIGMKVYKVSASDIVREIYVKNLNAEGENAMADQALLRANMNLYEKTCLAIKNAAKKLNVSGILNLYVFSHNKNPKIPSDNLQQALLSGGASNVSTDSETHEYISGSNDGKKSRAVNTNLHLATFRL